MPKLVLIDLEVGISVRKKLGWLYRPLDRGVASSRWLELILALVLHSDLLINSFRHIVVLALVGSFGATAGTCQRATRSFLLSVQHVDFCFVADYIKEGVS